MIDELKEQLAMIDQIEAETLEYIEVWYQRFLAELELMAEA
jgi:hypothetical protein